MIGIRTHRYWACSFLAASLLAAPAWAVTTLKMATEYPATSMPGEGVTTFADLVHQKSDGNVIIEPSFDAALGIKSADMIEAVEKRKVDAGDAFAGALATKYPIFGLSSLPFVADSVEKARTLTKLSRPAYEKLLAKHGQKLLYTTPWPASGIWSKEPVRNVDSLKALKIRTYDGTSQSVMRRAGAHAVNLPFSETMPQLASGELNAVLSSGDGGAGRKLWEYLPYFSQINYAMPISVATMNLQAYKSLDPNARKAIDQAAAQTEAEQWKRIQGRLEQNYATMRKNGVTIDTAVLTPVRQTLKKAAADSVKEWVSAAGPEGAAILKRFQKR